MKIHKCLTLSYIFGYNKEVVYHKYARIVASSIVATQFSNDGLILTCSRQIVACSTPGGIPYETFECVHSH